MMITLFSAAGESTASLLGSAAWILVSRPDIQRAVREDPALVGPFIEEALRYEAPFRGHYRHVRRDTELAGVALPAHSRLLLLWGRPTGILASSTRRTSFGSTARRRRGT